MIKLTLTLPILFDIAEATKMDSAEMTPVMEKIDPNLPSAKLNLRLKKYVTQDLYLSADGRICP